MTVTLTPRKKEKLSLLYQQFLRPQRSFTIRQVASLIGSLVSSFPGVQFGPLHYRPIEVDKDYHLRLHQGNFDAEMSLSPDSLAELHWWVNNIGAANKKVYQASPDVILYTDASGAGWGAKIENGISTCGIWSHDESVKHINCLELLAIHLALLSLFKNRNNIHVRIMCDNTTAVSYINEMGGCKSLECNAIAKMIWSWAITKGIWLSASHISGSVNVDADNLSRNLNLNLEWMLSANTFQKIITVYGQPDIDLFASRLNAQLEDYISWKPDPRARFIDAFTIDWSCFFFYAFPPFCMVSRCVQKIIQDQATGILVVPLWTTQPFFTVVLSLLVAVPRLLHINHQHLIHPTWDAPHPLQGQLKLMVCKLSGDPYASQTFRQTLSTQSCIPGETVLTNNITPISTDGCSFVFKRRVIPCVQL